jgi:hypothetical protein
MVFLNAFWFGGELATRIHLMKEENAGPRGVFANRKPAQEDSDSQRLRPSR